MRRDLEPLLASKRLPPLTTPLGRYSRSRSMPHSGFACNGTHGQEPYSSRTAPVPRPARQWPAGAPECVRPGRVETRIEGSAEDPPDVRGHALCSGRGAALRLETSIHLHSPSVASAAGATCTDLDDHPRQELSAPVRSGMLSLQAQRARRMSVGRRQARLAHCALSTGRSRHLNYRVSPGIKPVAP